MESKVAMNARLRIFLTPSMHSIWRRFRRQQDRSTLVASRDGHCVSFWQMLKVQWAKRELYQERVPGILSLCVDDTDAWKSLNIHEICLQDGLVLYRWLTETDKLGMVELRNKTAKTPGFLTPMPWHALLHALYPQAGHVLERNGSCLQQVMLSAGSKASSLIASLGAVLKTHR